LEKATDTVVLLVKELRKGVNLERLKLRTTPSSRIEGEADELMVEALRELYNGDHGAVHIIVLKDLYELIEKSSTAAATSATSSSTSSSNIPEAKAMTAAVLFVFVVILIALVFELITAFTTRPIPLPPSWPPRS